MNIEAQFNRIAKEYDINREKFIDCFYDFYKTTTDFIAANILSPKIILDLGAGTGLLSYYWYKHFPNSEYILVDIANEMLDIAKQRFKGLQNVNYKIMDYSKSFPNENFDCIISALSIHHLEHAEKERLFSRIYNKLPYGGLFVNYDQFGSSSSQINDWYNSYWENQLEHGSLNKTEIDLWHKRRKLDKECSVKEQIEMLEKNKFREIECVYSNRKFSVIIALK